jgi:hypothetical protein
LDLTGVYGWELTDAWYLGLSGYYRWQDQFQFDLGLVQWDFAQSKLTLDGVGIG